MELKKEYLKNHITDLKEFVKKEKFKLSLLECYLNSKIK